MNSRDSLKWYKWIFYNFKYKMYIRYARLVVLEQCDRSEQFVS
jgi:hypothetical protein